MITVIIGFIAAIGVIAWTITNSASDYSIYVNFPGLMVVLGGTAAIGMMSSKTVKLFRVIRSVYRCLLLSYTPDKLNKEIIECSNQITQGHIPQTSKHPFLQKTLELLRAGISGNSLHCLLIEKARQDLVTIDETIQILRSLSKYPPALGMIGTIIGIISLFYNMTSGGDKSKIGLSLSVALTTTLYGQILSNFFITPLVDLLIQAQRDVNQEYETIIEVSKLWSSKESLHYISEHLGENNAA